MDLAGHRAVAAPELARRARGRRADAYPPGESAELALLGGQGVRLELVQDLQPVLDRAQVHVGVGQRAAERRRQVSALGEAEDHLEAGALAKPGVVAAVEELERLHEELDLANPPGAELHVVAPAALGDE